MVTKAQYLAEKRKDINNYLEIYGSLIDLKSTFSTYLKSDAYKNMAAIGLIAFGTRGLNRLRIQVAQHSIRWFKNPTLSIYAGVGIILHSTIEKFVNSIKCDTDLIRRKEALNKLKTEIARLDTLERTHHIYTSNVNDKS